MARAPNPHSASAQDALQIIGPYWRSGGDKRLFTPQVRAAYRLWGKVTGTHLRPGHLAGNASRAELFVSQFPPPLPLLVQFDAFQAKRTGKAWKVPFVRHPHPLFSIDLTSIKDKPHWRVRFPGRSHGRAPTSQKLALMAFLGLTAYPAPKGKSLSTWSPAPPRVLETALPYARKFVYFLSGVRDLPARS